MIAADHYLRLQKDLYGQDGSEVYKLMNMLMKMNVVLPMFEWISSSIANLTLRRLAAKTPYHWLR